MANETIEKVEQFISRIKGNDSVVIKYKKKDNTSRNMNITLNFEKIPKADHPKSFELEKILSNLNTKKMIHVYDLEKKGWRAVFYNNIEWLEQEDIRFKLKKI